jgi:DNA-binding response OmpR family regulator
VSVQATATTKSGQVLVVDDDPDILDLVCALISRAGLDPVKAMNGEEGLRRFFDQRPDLVILDIAMPGMDGFKTLERIRDLSDVPILMLTARDAELDKVRGLRGGADDYVTKPFGRQELIARIESLLRRPKRPNADTAEVLSDQFVTIDFAHATVKAKGEEVSLTPLEFRLLAAFARHPHQVLTHDQVVELVWGNAGASRDQVKLYVGYLRRKLRETAGTEPIETVRGFGYRYRPEPA